MSVFIDVDREIDRLNAEVDKLDSARALAQHQINSKAIGLIRDHLTDQAEKIHELSGHVGSYLYCFQEDCADSRRLQDSIDKAARNGR